MEGTEGVAQEVEHLPTKHKALSSNPITWDGFELQRK
jgi:hypothetical protein